MIESISQFHFIRPGWLLLVPLAIGLWSLWLRSSEPLRGWRSQIAPALLKALTVGGHAAHSQQARWLLAGWLLAVIAIAGPTWRREPSPFAEESPPLMILLKADKGMEPANQQPTSLERAKLKIADLANARKGQPLGLIVYAGSAHLVLPPTKDTAVIAEMASDITSSIMPAAGDRLDLAIDEARRIMTSENVSGSFLVIADAVDTDTQQLAAAEKGSHGNGIQILAITDNDPSKLRSIQNAASTLHGSIVELAIDGSDITTIVHKADRTSFASVAGEETRWQEAGYWLVPILVILMALTFRRESSQLSGGAS
ncbi:transporter [Blastopirellula marina]|uniref:Transporter n=1 Tax=Blastopirellula marina TaxID=124 RepID=A0A2S8F568_9BACT|nr:MULTISPECIES: VWA domain-containing protein [Pirellulaceae]PQO27313.1 transporter [Blastopirellula marina]RCS47850.1 VWA domain-containing protein [Bremerella cremea]